MATPNVQRIELSEIDKTADEKQSEALFERDFSLIGNVAVEMSAVIGNARLSVEELFSLKNGSVLKLRQSVDEPLTFYLEGKPVARGHLVAVDDNFGVRISEVL